MTRLSVFAGTAVLALAVGAPVAPDPPAADASATPAPEDEVRSRRSRDPDLPRARPRIVLDSDDRASRSRVDEAVERFARAGLLLPDVVVGFSDSNNACDGHLGLFDRNSTPWRVEVCSELEFVLTHELAHAWAAANLNEAERAAYIAHRGLTAWHDPELEWRERGVEDAAFVIQQVLMVTHIRPDWSVWTERLDAYEQLTGGPPPPASATRSVSGSSAHSSIQAPRVRTQARQV